MVTAALPEITIHPNRSITVAEGEDVELRCEATGNGTLNYQWWKKAPKSAPRNATSSNGGKKLTLHSVMISDSGKYYCEVDSIRSMTVEVTVKS